MNLYMVLSLFFIMIISFNSQNYNVEQPNYHVLGVTDFVVVSVYVCNLNFLSIYAVLVHHVILKCCCLNT